LHFILTSLGVKITCGRTMQEIFYTLATPEEYFYQGRKFPFPKPQKCLQPDCLISIPPKKHGFYSRNAIEPNFLERIGIRRYYCEYCGKTISYLPCFCLPYIQYTRRRFSSGWCATLVWSSPWRSVLNCSVP